MKLLQILAYPFSIFYGIAVWLRNKMYDWGIFSIHEFDISVIAVGNLAVGGTGKTPHTEYLVNLLKNNYKIAILSRGYKRFTSGFLIVEKDSSVYQVGDEPLQFKRKFPDIIVAVDEKRARGIKKLKELFPDIGIVLLDDAFQHRAVKPEINILLTDYSKLYIEDFVIPSGNLREFAFESKRADIIIVTKTPTVLSPIDRRRIKVDIHQTSYQRLFFSHIIYEDAVPFTDAAKKITPAEVQSYSCCLLITGIAKPEQLMFHLRRFYREINHVDYPDHHVFSKYDIERIRKQFNDIFSSNKVIITTEKDAMRLLLPDIFPLLQDLPIFYIPISVQFHDKDGIDFNEYILKYVNANKNVRKFSEKFKHHKP
jgi:tetraacyldisaccharide 4'-kinase